MKRIPTDERVVRETPTIKEDKNGEVYKPGGTTMKVVQNTNVKYLFEDFGLDFKGCTRVDLVKLAAQQVIITIANRFRSSFTDRYGTPTGDPLKVADQWDRVWNVKSEIIEASRVSKDPKERAAQALAGLSPEELAEVLAKYQK